eukprot:5919087-Prymnesium_polylepis.1
MEDDMVKVVHGEREWLVRAAILRNCSATLDAMISESDSQQPRVIKMDDVPVQNVDAFFILATMISYDSNCKCPSFDQLSKLTCLAMPLVHKYEYDCRGLLDMLLRVQNQYPDAAGIISIMKHEPLLSTEWMNENAKKAVMHHVFQFWEPDRGAVLQLCQKKVADLPPALATMLLAYMWLELRPNAKGAEGKLKITASETNGLVTFRSFLPRPARGWAFS